MNLILTLAEAAAHYGCAVSTLKSAIARGALPATRFGRALAIRREDLARWRPQGRRGRPKKS